MYRFDANEPGSQTMRLYSWRHSRESGNPESYIERWDGLGPRWVPAFAGMTTCIY